MLRFSYCRLYTWNLSYQYDKRRSPKEEYNIRIPALYVVLVLPTLCKVSLSLVPFVGWLIPVFVSLNVFGESLGDDDLPHPDFIRVLTP